MWKAKDALVPHTGFFLCVPPGGGGIGDESLLQTDCTFWSATIYYRRVPPPHRITAKGEFSYNFNSNLARWTEGSVASHTDGADLYPQCYQKRDRNHSWNALHWSIRVKDRQRMVQFVHMKIFVLK